VIPVLGVPVLDRYDLLEEMEASVDTDVKRYYVLDNGGRYDLAEWPWWDRRHVCRPGANLGWGAAINLMIRANVAAPWWLFANDDMVFGPGHLAATAEYMWEHREPTIAHLAGMGYAAFAINAEAVERIGWFDESYHPAYVEDCDFNWRAKLVGDVTIIDIPGHSLHAGSQTIGGSPERKAANDITYRRNKDYHRSKWGSEPWEELFLTPFNNGSNPAVTTAPRLSRLREQAW
jgi:GT2 family glycosyltransferase